MRVHHSPRRSPFKEAEQIKSRRAATASQQNSTTKPAFYNTPIFIWFLSLLFLSIGGAYYSSHNQCLQEANRLTELHGKLKDELDFREISIRKIIDDAKDAEELRSALKTEIFLYAENKGKSLWEIKSQIARLVWRRRLSSFVMPDNQFYQFDNVTAESTFEGEEYQLMLGRNPAWQKLDLVRLKSIVRESKFGEFTFAKHYVVGPNCSVPNVFRQMIGGHPDILRVGFMGIS